MIPYTKITELLISVIREGRVGPGISRTGEPTGHRRSRSLWLEVEEGRENRAHTHNTSTSVGRSSAEEIAKLN